jgi:hypothetical protein
MRGVVRQFGSVLLILLVVACGSPTADERGPIAGLYRIADVNGGTAPQVTQHHPYSCGADVCYHDYAGWLVEAAAAMCLGQPGVESTLVVRRDIQLANDSTYTSDYLDARGCFVGGTLVLASSNQGTGASRLGPNQLQWADGWEITYPADVMGITAQARLTRRY